MAVKMVIIPTIPQSFSSSKRPRNMPITTLSNCWMLLLRLPQSSPRAVFSFRLSML